MKHFHLTCMCMLGGLLLTGVATRANADEWDKKTYVTISQPIEVPGAVLPPGKYVFKLLDSASDRHIVQIMNAEENHVYSTILAIPKQRMEPADKTILTFYEIPGGAPEPIRSWFYPGNTIGQEFVYPRRRAMEIALAMKQGVPILAESRQSAAEAAAPVETPAPAVEPITESANSADRIAPPDEAAAPAPLPSPETAASEPEEQPAQLTDTTAAEPAMPHTAGNTAALGLIGLCCLGVAASLRAAVKRGGSKS